MSEDEAQDVELRTIVAQTLENNGVLPKIRAELRASVFLALEDQHVPMFINKQLVDFVSTSEGSLVFSLVREFLEYFELDSTLSVFDPETKHQKDYLVRDRSQMVNDLKFNNLNFKKGPLLAHIVRLVQGNELNQIDIKESHLTEALKKIQQEDNKPNLSNGALKNEPIKSQPLLGNLPPLVGVPRYASSQNEDVKNLQKEILDLGLDTNENNYEEDFNSSASASPRDDPSKTTNSEIEEELTLSVADEVEEEVIDTTISNLSAISADHLEDV